MAALARHPSGRPRFFGVRHVVRRIHPQKSSGVERGHRGRMTTSATNPSLCSKYQAVQLQAEKNKLIERYFKLAENQTSFKQEMLGGLTTFVTMAYVIVVNPRILADAGMPVDGVVFATCIAGAVATMVMGLYANYPIALAPGMSLNAYFTYTVCLGMHVPWQTALGAVFFSGVLFVLLTVTRVREQIVNGIPLGLKHATAGGIGMFIAFVGLRSAKLVVGNPATFVSLGSFADPGVQAACVGILLTLA